uniref:Uncharacterized protein n=1 Tax=viral metagenome TaxID=1070528 RepID=A0A6C0C9Y1_9ZZZZ
MSKSFQILLFLKELLPNETAKIITYIYIAARQRFKPGQLVFESPCGHLLRSVESPCPKTFFCPISNEYRILNKEIYLTSACSCSVDDLLCLVETNVDSKNIGMKCEICKRHWDYLTDESTSELKQKVVCFCGKITEQFPCATCPIKNCCIPGCDQICHKKSKAPLCYEHYRCIFCRSKISYRRTYSQWWFEMLPIVSYCKCPYYNDGWDYSLSLSLSLFDEDHKFLNDC